MNQLFIEAQDLPPLATHDYEALRDDIARRGIINPIVVNDTGVIIDGHHRMKIAQELGIKCPTTVVELDEGEAQIVAWALNFKRRSVTMDQKREAALALNQRGMTQEEIGDRIGVARRTVSYWLDTTNGKVANGSKDQRVRVARHLHPEIHDRSEAGETQAQLAADYECSQQAISKIVRMETNRRQNAELKQASQKMEPGEYDVIVIDPPWPMQKIDRDVAPNQVGFEYPVMQEEEIAAMPLPLAADCHVWIWTTHKFLPMALRCAEAWGLKYVCTFVWHKPGGFQPFGLPQYNCEFALYCRRGSPKFADLKAFPVCFNAPRGAHSEKPGEFYDMVRRVTDGRRIDIFNRRPITGFDTWGNEAAANG